MPDYKKYSNEMEKQIARDAPDDAIKEINSGAMRYHKGDVRGRGLLYEAKRPTTRQKTYTIKEADLKKIREEAREAGRQTGVLVFTFMEKRPNGDLVNYVAALDRDFYDIYGRMLDSERMLSELSELVNENLDEVPMCIKDFMYDKGLLVKHRRPKYDPNTTLVVEDMSQFLQGETVTFIRRRNRNANND